MVNVPSCTDLAVEDVITNHFGSMSPSFLIGKKCDLVIVLFYIS